MYRANSEARCLQKPIYYGYCSMPVTQVGAERRSLSLPITNNLTTNSIYNEKGCGYLSQHRVTKAAWQNLTGRPSNRQVLEKNQSRAAPPFLC